MKRSKPMRRTRISSSKHRIRPVNPEQKAKRKKRRPKVTAAQRKAVLERDGHQCTAEMSRDLRALGRGLGVLSVRCPNTEDLEVHHEHYKQTPEDPLNGLRIYCRYHHHQIESQLRPWNFR